MKYIEIAVADSFDDHTLTTFDALAQAQSIAPASQVGRGDMEALLIELSEDVRAAFGTNQDGDEIDTDALDWPDLEVTYQRVVAMLQRIES